MIMNTLSYIKYWGITVLAIIVTAFLFVSCDGMIYNDEGDCSVRYRLKFRYDMNLKFADAFAHEVKSSDFTRSPRTVSWYGSPPNKVVFLHQKNMSCLSTLLRVIIILSRGVDLTMKNPSLYPTCRMDATWKICTAS